MKVRKLLELQSTIEERKVPIDMNGELNYMTLTEFVDKLNELKNDSKNADKQIYFFTEDDYQTFDVMIDKIEIEDDKIFLS